MPHSEQQSPSTSKALRAGAEDEEPEETFSPSSYLGLKKTLSPRATPKSVSISNQPEVISPLLLGDEKNIDNLDLNSSRSPRKLSLRKRVSSKRLSARQPIDPTSAVRSNSITSLISDKGDGEGTPYRPHHHHHHHHDFEHFVNQVSEWIKEERTKHASKRNGRDVDHAGPEAQKATATENRHHRRPSDTSFSLSKLEEIIKQNVGHDRRSRRSRDSLRRKRILQRKPSSTLSDTDAYDSDTQVPSSDAILDNSKTMAYTGGASDESDMSSPDELERTTSYKDLGAWNKFKFEIVRLTHTLRLKGWRDVPWDMSSDITVSRLSGALTNAVYVVSPPSDLPTREDVEDGADRLRHTKPPAKLLLRIYGPQVEHLIDREAELAILRRLGRKNIGPKLLGTFQNGRFEEFFYAKTLTPDDLRDPSTSIQIAKRMRELHDGIELLESERDAGAFVWRNWDKWVARVEQIVCWLDCQIRKLDKDAKPVGTEAWKRRGFICGVPWKQFRAMVEKYRSWLFAQYGGVDGIRDQLVFAHNDTQYGNILRLTPTGESPLLLPANTHKQLVVIDFEYACANLPGLEFANHFTEWCYNYHDERKPYAFHPQRYPTPEEQDRFVRAYVRHRPQVTTSTPKTTPATPPTHASLPGEPLSRRPTSSISDFMLDARAPSTTSTTQAKDDETARQTAEDHEVARLLQETRMWRLANTAQWVAWGIVQAKVDGMPDFDANGSTTAEAAGENEGEAVAADLEERADIYKDLVQHESDNGGKEKKEEAEEEFDNLGYAQHRAMFFWADAVQLGLVELEALPEEMRGKLKRVAY